MEVNSLVYILSEFVVSDSYLIKSHQVGIVLSLSKDKAIVDFIGNNIEVELSISNIKEFDPNKTGDAFDVKVCNICHTLIDTNEFSSNQNGKNNRVVRRPSCKECRKTIDGTKVSSTDRKIFTHSKPHLIKFTCPICDKTTIPGLTSRVVLDHDHITGKPRGWVCDSCNTGLGRFKDDIILLERAIEYLKNN